MKDINRQFSKIFWFVGRNFPSEGLDEIELRNVQLTLANSKTLLDDGSAGTKEMVETRHGPITIAIAGDRTKPVILTYHDLGLNHVTNFQVCLLNVEYVHIFPCLALKLGN